MQTEKNNADNLSPNKILAVTTVGGLLEEPHCKVVPVHNLQTLPLHGALAQAILHVVDNVGLAGDFQQISGYLARTCRTCGSGCSRRAGQHSGTGCGNCSGSHTEGFSEQV